MFRTALSVALTTRWLLALTLFTTLWAGPARLAVARSHALPAADLCSVVHGNPVPLPPAGHGKDPATCAACAFCTAPPFALPSSNALLVKPAGAALCPAAADVPGRSDWAAVVARARGPPSLV